jgi:hypothetical protein
MPKGRLLKQWELDKIKELSQTHYPREIAIIIGCTRHTVRNIQKNPKNGIDNPKTKILSRQVKTRVEVQGYFDIDKWQRLMAI